MVTPDEPAIKFSIGVAIGVSSGLHRAARAPRLIKIDAETLDVPVA
jgi:hypothetical protein